MKKNSPRSAVSSGVCEFLAATVSNTSCSQSKNITVLNAFSEEPSCRFLPVFKGDTWQPGRHQTEEGSDAGGKTRMAATKMQLQLRSPCDNWSAGHQRPGQGVWGRVLGGHLRDRTLLLGEMRRRTAIRGGGEAQEPPSQETFRMRSRKHLRRSAGCRYPRVLNELPGQGRQRPPRRAWPRAGHP